MSQGGLDTFRHSHKGSFFLDVDGRHGVTDASTCAEMCTDQRKEWDEPSSSASIFNFLRPHLGSSNEASDESYPC